MRLADLQNWFAANLPSFADKIGVEGMQFFNRFTYGGCNVAGVFWRDAAIPDQIASIF